MPIRDDRSPEKKPLDSDTGFLNKARQIIYWLLGEKSSHSAVDASIDVEQKYQQVRLDERQHYIDELKKYSNYEVVLRAEKAIEHLKSTKSSLIEEFGSSSLPFITRHIDPVLSHSLFLLESLGRLESDVHSKISSSNYDKENIEKKENMISDLLEGAVDAVELYALINDTEHLKRKIVIHIHDSVRQAVEKDIQVLISYCTTAIKGLEEDTGEIGDEFFNFIETKIDPILEKLEQLIESFPNTLELNELFSWRQKVDVDRHGLMTFGILLIDKYIVEIRMALQYCNTNPTESYENIEWDVGVLDSRMQNTRHYLSRLIEVEYFFCQIKKWNETSRVDEVSVALQEFHSFLEHISLREFPRSLSQSMEYIKKLELLQTVASNLLYHDEPPIT